jgi:hypothetical protein
MGDSTLTQTTLAYSTAIESAVNTVPQTAGLYTTYETTARTFVLPNAEKQSDEPRIGGGAASAYPSFQRSRVLEPMGIEIADVVNVERFPTQLRQHMGTPEVSGDIAIVEATKGWRHFYYVQNFDSLGRQKPTRTYIVKNNGAYFAYAGGTSGTMQISQSGIDDPKFSNGIVTTGYYEDVDLISGFGSLTVPTNDPLKLMLGAETSISYNDGTTRSLNGRWKSFTFNSNNNIDTGDLRAGLPRVQNSACPTRGWYRNFLNASDESVSLEFRVAHDDNMREWEAAQLDTVLTTFDILMKGSCIPTTAANTQYSVKLSVGKCYFRNIRGGDDNNLAVLDVTVFPVRNGSYFGVWRAEVVNGQSTVTV